MLKRVFFVIKTEKWQILLAMKYFKRILLTVLCLCLLGIMTALVYYHAATKNVTLNPARLSFNENTLTLLDKDKNLISLGIEANRQAVSSDELPWHTKQAFIDVEDRRFYHHDGFDRKGIARALLHNLKSRSLKEGASTISQQLIKNSHLSQEKTLKRKLQEWKLTKQLEKKYTKDEILTLYLNTIYFGHNCFGIASASEFYFNKKPRDLTLAESAMLAGMIKSPNNYSPFRHAEKCQNRRACVLRIMHENGSISEEEQHTANATPLPISAKKSGKNKGYAYFVMDELSTLSDEFDFKIGGNMQIQTYMDKNLQGYMETLSASDEGYGKTFLSLNAKTGGFTAAISIIGNERRLPASLIKPLLVYAPALEENHISPATPILDEKVDYGGYIPQNHDGKYHGYVSARECVERSLNIPAVKLLSSLGIDKCVDYMQKMGLSVEENDKSLALALGGMQHGYTLKDLLAAYSVFPNGGVKKPCGFIEEIKINGATVYKKPKTTRRVFNEDSAYLMTDMLKGTAQNGTAKKLRTLPFEIAAKTGTVGTKNGNTDAYALSYTTNDCIAVWCGNADNEKIDTTGGGVPCKDLKAINEFLYNKYQKNGEVISPFTMPKSVVKIALDKTMYYDTHTILRADDNSPADFRFSELFKKDAIPLKSSTSFTLPTIPTPSVCVVENKVIITLNPSSPTYYRYRIVRKDYATHTTVYEGELLTQFVDEHVEKDKYYTYTITPIYKNNVGKEIALPTVFTATQNSTLVEDKQITQKDWWEK